MVLNGFWNYFHSLKHFFTLFSYYYYVSKKDKKTLNYVIYFLYIYLDNFVTKQIQNFWPKKKYTREQKFLWIFVQIFKLNWVVSSLG